MALNFLQISLTNKCNFDCHTCPMGRWRNQVPRFPINNGELIPFLEREVNPKEWVVELTGGEPSLYEGLDELLQWLSSHGYYTLVKTNGSGNIRHYQNVKICAAFHRLNEPPKNFDEYLIIDKLQREEKETYCKEHGIAYKVIGLDKENFDNSTHGFGKIAFVNAAGHCCRCQAVPPTEALLEDESDDMNRINHSELIYGNPCPSCKAALDAWKFLPEGIRLLSR